MLHNVDTEKMKKTAVTFNHVHIRQIWRTIDVEQCGFKPCRCWAYIKTPSCTSYSSVLFCTLTVKCESSPTSVHISYNKSGLPQTDPRDTLRHAHRSYCIRRWTLSVMNWWRSSAELSWQHLRRSTCPGEIFIGPEFGTKIQRKVPIFCIDLNFLIKQLKASWP